MSFEKSTFFTGDNQMIRLENGLGRKKIAYFYFQRMLGFATELKINQSVNKWKRCCKTLDFKENFDTI